MEKDKYTFLSEIAFTCQRPVSSSDKLFETRSRVILSNVSSFFGRKVKTKDFWKISINVNSSNEQQHLKVVAGVLRFNISYNISSFLTLSIDDQKTEMLELVVNTLHEVFSAIGLDKRKLQGLNDFVIERQFENNFSGLASNRKNISAHVLCQQKFEKTLVYLIMTKENLEVQRTLVLTTSPEEFIFNVYLKKPKWISDNKLSILASNGEEYIVDFCYRKGAV